MSGECQTELLNPLRYADGSIHQIFRALAPVSWQDSFWAITGYPEAQYVLSNPTVFSSAYGTGLSSDTEPGLVSLNLSDPPLHTELRAAVETWLRGVKPIYCPGKNPIRELPRQTLQAIFAIDSQRASDLQRLAIGVARHLPGANARLLQELEPIGCPVSLLGLRPLAKNCPPLKPPVAAEPLHSGARLVGQFLAQPREATGLRPLAFKDQLYLKRLLTLASLESSSAALASLARHSPEPDMLEEMLRLHPPIQRFGRHVVRDTELAGQTLRAGQRVVIFFAAANRDPRVFSEPDRWKSKRPTHLSFGYGPHRCPGSQLARLQLRLLQPNPPNPPQRVYPSNFSLTPWE